MGPGDTENWTHVMTTSPELSMMWEPGDPAPALTERFGFTDTGHAATWLTDVIRERWGLDVEGCDRLMLSSTRLLAWMRIDGDRVVAKCTVDPNLFAGLAEIDQLIAWLGSEGIPVAAPIPTIASGLRAERDGISLALSPAVEGGALDAGDEQQLIAAGRTLGRLHLTLMDYPTRLSCVPGETRQLVHGDFRSANILQRHGQITAVLDFDETSYRSRAWEVGRSSVLLGTRYRDWRPLSAGRRTAFLTAYQEVAPLTINELRSVDGVVAAVLQHFGWR